AFTRLSDVVGDALHGLLGLAAIVPFAMEDGVEIGTVEKREIGCTSLECLERVLPTSTLGHLPRAAVYGQPCFARVVQKRGYSPNLARPEQIFAFRQIEPAEMFGGNFVQGYVSAQPVAQLEPAFGE